MNTTTELQTGVTRDIYGMPAFVEAPDDIGGGIQLSLAADYDELDALAARARAGNALVEGPTDTDWNTGDLTVTTPQGLRLVFTARRPDMLRDQVFEASMEQWNAKQPLPTD